MIPKIPKTRGRESSEVVGSDSGCFEHVGHRTDGPGCMGLDTNYRGLVGT